MARERRLDRIEKAPRLDEVAPQAVRARGLRLEDERIVAGRARERRAEMRFGHDRIAVPQRIDVDRGASRAAGCQQRCREDRGRACAA